MIRILFVMLCAVLSSACAVKGEFPTMGSGTSIRLSHNLLQRDPAQVPIGSYAFVPDDKGAGAAGFAIGMFGLIAVIGYAAGMAASAAANRAQDLDADLSPMVPVLVEKMRTALTLAPELKGTEVLVERGPGRMASSLVLYFIRNADGTASPALRLGAAYFPDGRLFSAGNTASGEQFPAVRYYHWVSGKKDLLKPGEGWLTSGLAALRQQMEEGTEALIPVLVEEMQTRKQVGAENNAPMIRLEDRLGPPSALGLCLKPLKETETTIMATGTKGYYCKETTGLVVLPKVRFVPAAPVR